MRTLRLNRAERRQKRATPASPRWRPVAAAAVSALLLAVIAAIAVVNRNSIPQSASEAPIYAPLRVGAAAPAFAVTTLDGRRIDSRIASGPIMLEVFATWCPHCQRETVLLNALERRFGTKLGIIAVSGSDTAGDRTSAESLGDVEAFARYFRVEYPVAFDPNLAVAKEYLQGGFPTIVFVSRAKRITAIEKGEVPLQRLIGDANSAMAARQ